MKGLVIKSTGSWYRVRTEEGSELDVRLRGRFKLENKKITNPIAVGDEVALCKQRNEWAIEEIKSRKNYIIRSSPRKKYHGHIIASNLDQAVVIATLKKPRTSLGFIDRFLATLETFRIPGAIIFSKTDLLTKKELEELEHLCFIYGQKVGYPCHQISLKDSFSHNRLKEIFLNKKTLISGHSGVGKSTLINKLIPRASQKTAEISHFANKGVHTTTFAEMFFMDKHSAIIDTPGIKELAIAEIGREELAHYFPEMRHYLGKCKFHNCLHVNEPGCKVHEALGKGEITEERFNSYLSMLEADDSRR